ncbi:hypothetical protein [Streptomyces sp. NPDC058657]|uniref:hypothetical protein n=1 Tax=unclassified Streptomyces TaxID=2593676 RepID=UPI003662844B
MAWSEWQQLKSGPGTPPGGRADLVAHQDDLGAVGHEAYVLHRALLQHADVAGRGLNSAGSCTSSRAAASLTRDHFAMGAALETTTTLWTSQLRSLLQACAHISNHLDHSKASHARDEAKVRATIRGITAPEIPVSRLNTYFG